MNFVCKAGLLLLLHVFLQSPSETECVDISVNVSSTVFVGTVGQVRDKPDMKYAEFLGIRYGEAPTGDNRFKKANMYRYGNNIVQAKKHGYVCPQDRHGHSLLTPTDVMNEDCLFLNIFVPLNNGTSGMPIQNSSQVEEKKAVYIFIHGGSFVAGSANLYDSPLLSSQGDIVVVNINYRLGILGFLATDDDVIPSNLGLWDQHLAISWVYNHIEAFGGDRTRITVGGQSAGSFSSILQSFYKGNDQLFKNTIAESGTPLARKIVSDKGLPTALAFAKAAGCNLGTNSSSMDIRSCFMKLPASNISLVHAQAVDGNAVGIGPTFDDDFISKETFALFPQKFQRFNVPKRENIPSSFAKKNLLIGFNSGDGEIVYEITTEKMVDAKLPINVSAPISPGMSRYLIQSSILTKQAAVVNAVVEEYTDWTRPSDPIVRSGRAIDVLTDVIFAVPSMATAHVHATAQRCHGSSTKSCNETHGHTYLYEFSLPLTSPLARKRRFPWFRGASHGIELVFLSDRRARLLVPGLSDLMITSWSNFVKFGKPHTGGQTEWPEYRLHDQSVFQLSQQPKSVPHAHARKIHFWNQYLPDLEENLYDAFNKGQDSVKAHQGGTNGNSTALGGSH